MKYLRPNISENLLENLEGKVVKVKYDRSNVFKDSPIEDTGTVTRSSSGFMMVVFSNHTTNAQHIQEMEVLR